MECANCGHPIEQRTPRVWVHQILGVVFCASQFPNTVHDNGDKRTAVPKGPPPMTTERDDMARIIQMSCKTSMSDETARAYADNLTRSGYGKLPPPPAHESVEWEELCAATEALAAAALTFQNAKARYTAKYPKDSNAR